MTESTNTFWTNAYKDNIGKLIGTCYRYTGNYQLSEDLAHDAFLKAINKASTFKEEGKFEAWLRRIVVNHTLQYLRSRKKEPYLDELTHANEPTELVDSPDDTAEPVAVTSAELIDSISYLPEHHRTVLNLYVFEQFTHAQIGAVLGISEGTSKSHLARARRKLKQLLAQQSAKREPVQNKRKAMLLLLGTNEAISDQAMRLCVEDSSIPPQHPLSPKDILLKSGTSKIGMQAIRLSIIVASGLAVVVIAGKLFTHSHKETEQQKSVATIDVADSLQIKQAADSATISKDGVIVQRKQSTHMKPLDSLALLLALAPAESVSPLEKDSIKNNIELLGYPDSTSFSDSISSRQTSTVVMPGEILQKDRGTFRATELYWSEKDKEVYFKGKVRVNFRDQQFSGKGSFTILGKVDFLVIDGQPARQGKLIKLEASDYRLSMLDSSEAAGKYGEKAQQGAVEIVRVKQE